MTISIKLYLRWPGDSRTCSSLSQPVSSEVDGKGHGQEFGESSVRRKQFMECAFKCSALKYNMLQC